jgi:NTE family protein
MKCANNQLHLIMLSLKPHSLLMYRYFQRLLLLISLSANIFCSCLINIHAQNKQDRPTVGLVLSGGGAHGIAHLGVIKVMEEAGLRPDYITGVSMGSIIGGFYSLGYSADSLYKILKKINWDDLLTNVISENKVIFHEKSRFNNSILSLPLSARKVVFPSGLINGQQVENTLSFYSWPAANINDFSKLPIPFMCVATDIITYKKADLFKGYLPDAIRASFSVPSIFTPLKIDTMLLLDGGLIRNFAASEARNMGADIVIGSYVGFKAYKEEDLQSVSGIMKQIALFRSLEDFNSEKKLVNVLIKPNIDEISIARFDNVDSLVQRGYKAALPYKVYFRKLADSLNSIGLQKPIAKILDKQDYTFNKIEIKGNKNYSDFQILGVLDIEPENKVDKYVLSNKIDLLYGKGWFDKVKYRIVPRNDSLILVIDCNEKPQGMLYGSLHYDNSLLSGIIIGLSAKNLLTQRSILNFNSYIGQYYRFDANYLQFIDKNQKLGLTPGFYADNTLIPNLSINSEYGEVVSRNLTPGISLNKMIGLNNLMDLSLNYETQFLILRFVSDAHLENLSYNYLSSTYDYQRNTLDRKYFPKHGMKLNLFVTTSKLLSGGIKTDSSKVVIRENDDNNYNFERFYTFRGSIKKYFSSVDKLTFSIGGEVLLITESDSVSAKNNFYLLGGAESLNKRSVPMIGFHGNEIQVKNLAGVRTELDFEVIKDLHLNLKTDIFAAQEVTGNKGYSLLTGYGLEAGYMSIIGPLKVGLMYGTGNPNNYYNKLKGYISIGYNF